MKIICYLVSAVLLLGLTAYHLQISSKSPSQPQLKQGEALIYEEFLHWTQKHNKKYSGDIEKFFRYKNFLENYAFVKDFKSDRVRVGLNHFSDLSLKEFSALNLGRKPHKQHKTKRALSLSESYPDSVDWRKTDYIPPVQNQGNCGSCYAFSAAESLSSTYAIAFNASNLMFSPQEIVDCTQKWGNDGCDGGLEYDAWNYTQFNGIASLSDYVYTAKQGICKKNLYPRYFPNKGGLAHIENDVNQFKYALAGRPVSVGVSASNQLFFGYAGGVVGEGCTGELDHSVYAVAYNEEYAVIQNSWGTGWGEDGFINLAFKTGACGFLEDASYPIF